MGFLFGLMGSSVTNRTLGPTEGEGNDSIKVNCPSSYPFAKSPRIIRHDAKLSSLPRFWLEGFSSMSFFSPPAAAFKAQALNRVEGFHPDDSSTPSSSTPGNNSSFGDLFSTTTTTSGGGTTTTMSAHQHQQHHGFDLPDPFRKFPSSVKMWPLLRTWNQRRVVDGDALGWPG